MTTPKEATFENSMKKLDEIVEKLESGDLSLDDSLKLYEEGVRLSQLCSKRLEQAQSKIESLMRSDKESVNASSEAPKAKQRTRKKEQ